jgi:D-inositol-3-phosphate glycosyltransferase
MKVAMVSEHASPLATLGGVDAGGQNVYVDALSRELARRGCEVVVYTRRDDTTLPRRVELCPGVVVEHVAAGPAVELPKDDLFPHMPQLAAGLARAWRRDRPDVVHAHFWMSGHASLLAAESFGLPVVQTFHALGTVKRRYQGGMDTSPPQRIEIERGIAASADRILATCSDEVFELLRMGVDNERVAVVPCGVDVERFAPHGPIEPREAGRRRLLYVGRVVRRKGVGNLIEALPRLPGVELTIAGGPPREELDDDPESRRLTELARRHRVADRVDLRGRVPRERLPELIRSADAVVSVPWYEPFGIVPLEAMACGVPVIASAVGGMIDSVVDGRTGVHVPPRDPERLAEAAGELLADAARRRAYGLAGAKRARRLYDWRRVGSQVLEAYEGVVAGRVARRSGRDRGPEGSRAHLGALAEGLSALEAHRSRLDGWGEWLGERLLAGGRLLAAGNGGSAAEAQHLTSELVGRFEVERRPLSAIALHADTSSLTAIGNDYGIEDVFARQVEGHGRVGDVLLALSTSGRSENLLRAAEAANRLGLVSWALTGPAPNPLAALCDEAIAIDAASPATVQELHLVAVHVICGAVDRCISRLDGQRRERLPEPAPVRALQRLRQAVR